MIMKIYIAARFERKQEVRDLCRLLTEKGHEITADWTLHKPIKPYEKNQELAQQYSIEDINGVKDSDIFILLSDEGGSIGMYVELGIAILSNLMFGKPIIYIVGDYTSRSMFYFHPSVNRRKNINHVLKEIEKIQFSHT